MAASMSINMLEVSHVYMKKVCSAKRLTVALIAYCSLIAPRLAGAGDGVGAPPAAANPSPIPSGSPQAPSAPASAVPSAVDIAFDEIDRTIPGTGTAPPLNGFRSDLAAIHDYHEAGFGPPSADMAEGVATASRI